MGILGKKLPRSKGCGKHAHVQVTECMSRTVLGKHWEFRCSRHPYSNADGGPVAGWEGEMERQR